MFVRFCGLQQHHLDTQLLSGLGERVCGMRWKRRGFLARSLAVCQRTESMHVVVVVVVCTRVRGFGVRNRWDVVLVCVEYASRPCSSRCFIFRRLHHALIAPGKECRWGCGGCPAFIAAWFRLYSVVPANAHRFLALARISRQVPRELFKCRSSGFSAWVSK